MASISKRGNSWRAIVRRRGVSKSESFPTKAQAQAWAIAEEGKILSGKTDAVVNRTFGELLDKYLKEVTPTKRGKRWEAIRIELLRNYEIEIDETKMKLGDIKLSEFHEPHVAAWRNARLNDVSGSSVVREWQILSNAFNVARKEWKWVSSNPFSEVKQPKKNPPRDRIATQDEIDRLIHASGFVYDEPPKTIIARVMAAWLYASKTAKRCKEITRLTPGMVHLDSKVVEVSDDSKTGARDVPLFDEAAHIIRPVLELGLNPVFGLTESQVDSHWRKITKKAIVDNLTFHDAKHCACTWMVKEKGINVFDLGRIVGTRDLRVLSIYYNRSASDIAHGR